MSVSHRSRTVFFNLSVSADLGPLRLSQKVVNRPGNLPCPCLHERPTRCEVIGRKILSVTECFATIVTEREHLRRYTVPAQVAFESPGDVGLSSSWEADEYDEDFSGVPEKT